MGWLLELLSEEREETWKNETWYRDAVESWEESCEE